MTEPKDDDPRLTIKTFAGEATPAGPIHEVQVTNDTQGTSTRSVEDEIENQMRGAALNRSACPRQINRFFGFAFPDRVHLALGGVALAEGENGNTDVSTLMLECYAFDRVFAVDLVQKLVEWMNIAPNEVAFPTKDREQSGDDKSFS